MYSNKSEVDKNYRITFSTFTVRLLKEIYIRQHWNYFCTSLFIIVFQVLSSI